MRKIKFRIDKVGIYLMGFETINVDAEGWSSRHGNIQADELCGSLSYQWPNWLMMLLGVPKNHSYCTNHFVCEDNGSPVYYD